ncbi:hypothetical protein HJC23_005227 [Cyclotella cryptica]|uniref:RNA polymerase I-specific transcription initiation factor RRN3 n=1 Tax=Cyclotella cryptica TaxID=29204 RepID=A0ABD3NUE8_9STRA|eukprot:CCRYP_019686-RB/>CCRYP_019686-RB protein AED:0.21 eAED:0.21 QI:142/1/1/1/0.5/0.4/5/1009/1048
MTSKIIAELHHDCDDASTLNRNESGEENHGHQRRSSAVDSIDPASDYDRFPFHFFNIDPNQRLPRPPAPESELLAQAEQLVSWAVSSKHENSPALHMNKPANDPDAQPSKKPHDLAKDEPADHSANAAVEAAKCHSLLADLLARKSNPALLHAALHAILTSNHGRELDRLVSHSKLHAQTIHLIMRLDPFVPGVEMGGRLRDLEGLRKDRKNDQDCSNGEGETTAGAFACRRGVQIAEASIIYKEDQKYIAPVLPFFRYHIADVHLYLIVALVSNNSLLSVSAVRAIWKLLTDFGPKCENALKEAEEERRRSIVEGRNTISYEGAVDDDVEDSTAATKRKKADTVIDDPSLQQHQEDGDSAINSTVKSKLPTTSEGLKLVPGMNGLSVDFVKESFYGDNASDFDESICSEHLARGRVYRLLLALVNIFRLNHRSKNELLREVSNNFPYYKRSSSALHRWYINMCLQLVYIAPTLEGPIVNLLVDQALGMDVQIKITDKGGVFLDIGNEHNSIEDKTGSKKRSFQVISQDNVPDNDDTLTDNAHVSSGEDMDRISKIAEKLDYLMNILCQRIEQLTSFSPDSLPEALAAVVNARRFYRHLLAIFDNKVRTTDRSKFVPFIYFVLFGREHECLEAVGKLMAKRSSYHQRNDQQTSLTTGIDISEHESDTVIDHGVISAPINETDFLYRGFCAKLIDLFYNPVDAGALPSQTVICCLASFVSRATYVCPETVCECVAAILKWAQVYLEAHSGPEVGEASVPVRQKTSSGTQRPREIHALFYTACQAAFYMMCFRGAEALHYYHEAWLHRDEDDSPYAQPESVDLGPKRWKLICNHPLQPLKYCLESVRVEFLHVAEDLDLFLEDSLEDAKQFLDHLWCVNDEGNSNLRVNKIKTVSPSRKRSSIISTAATQEKKRLDGGVGGLGKGSNPLDSYFPFDPYLLKVSYRHIHPYYRNWEDCAVNMEDNNKVSASETEVEINSSYNEPSDFQDADEDDNTAFTHSEEENDDEESNHDEIKNNRVTNMFVPQCGCSGFEMELRRSRAMSTGSQCSW